MYAYIHVCIKSIYIIYLYLHAHVYGEYLIRTYGVEVYTHTLHRIDMYTCMYMRMFFIWPWSWWWSIKMIQTWGKFQCFKWHQSFDKNEEFPSCASEQWTLLPFFGPTAQLRWNEVVEDPLQKENLKWWTNASDGHLANNLKGMAKWSMALFKAFKVLRLQAACFTLLSGT